MKPSFRRFSVCAILAIGLGSCSSSSRDIKGRDHGAFLPAFRTVVNVRGQRSTARNRPITELELDVAGADGDHSISGMKVGEYRMVEGGASMRFGREFRDRVQFVGITGIGLNRIDINDRATLPSVNDEHTDWGVRLGGELRVKISSWLSGQVRVVSFLRPFDLVSTQAEVALVFGSPDNLGFLVGYKDWRYRDESSSLNGVDDVDLRVDGLFLALEVRF
jgi:hypothetical protein